jgi:nitrate reductase gamma subunit
LMHLISCFDKACYFSSHFISAIVVFVYFLCKHLHAMCSDMGIGYLRKNSNKLGK